MSTEVEDSARAGTDEWVVVSSSRSRRTKAALTIQTAFRQKTQAHRGLDKRAPDGLPVLPDKRAPEGFTLRHLTMTISAAAVAAALAIVTATPSPKLPVVVLALEAGARPVAHHASTALVLPVSLHRSNTEDGDGAIPRLLGVMVLWLMSYAYAHVMDPLAEQSHVPPVSSPATPAGATFSKTAPNIATAKRVGAPNPWNEFQKAVGGCGLKRPMISALYAKLKLRMQVATKNRRNVSAASLLMEVSTSWNDFQTLVGACGLSKPAISALYAKTRAAAAA